jgi:opacity protein-like surface antigen
MLLPVLCRAQVAEISFKGGPVINDLHDNILYAEGVSQSTDFGGGIALTFGLPAGFRAGFALSAYQVRANASQPVYDKDGKITDDSEGIVDYGTPLVPLELLLMKRFNVSRLRIDIGAAGGMSLNKTFKAEFDDPALNIEATDKANNWLTYGAMLGVQYRLSCRWAIGVEAQAKTLKMGTAGPVTTLIPVMAKLCVSL